MSYTSTDRKGDMSVKINSMKNNSSVQSLDRGLKVLELLAENDKMTASAIAEKLGLHQSSASRLLNSLVTAGLVCKPSFHSFSLDYGVLLFAGKCSRDSPWLRRPTSYATR